MDGDSLPLIIILAICLVGSAYFSCVESALTLCNKVRMRNRADNGDRRAKNVMYLTDHFEDALTALLIGNNIVNIAAASLATVIAVENWGHVPNISVYCTVLTTVVVFFCGEMIPKSLATDRSDTLALFCAGFLRFLMKILKPLVFVFGGITRKVSELFGKNEQPSITEEELYDIIETIGEEGVVDEEQSDLLKSAMDFSDTTAGDVMTMREDIFYLDINTPKEQMLAIARDAKHSRFPVCDGDLDHIIGFLQLRWFLKSYAEHKEESVRKYIRKNITKPYFVRKDAKIDELLETMRQHKIHMAIVTDGEGRTLGIVTIEDFLEELVGEIWDEEDVVDERFYSLGGNRFAADPDLTLAEAFRRMKRPLRGTPLGMQAHKTLGALLTEYLGATPEEESSFMKDGYEFTVEDTGDESEIRKVVIRICDEDEEAEDVSDGKQVRA